MYLPNIGSLTGLEAVKLILSVLLCQAYQARLIMLFQLAYLNQVGLVSTCAKIQLFSWSRSCQDNLVWRIKYGLLG